MFEQHRLPKNQEKTSKLEWNEKLEFLGDNILSFILTKHLWENFKHLNEGQLSKAKAACQSRNSYKIARSLDLHKTLIAGQELLSQEITNESLPKIALKL